jgi:drug/metabolite transporter (DMT)-like permease
MTANKYTAFGALAIVLWSTTIAFSRTLTQAVGTLTAGAAVYMLAGLAAMVYAARSPGGLRGLARLPRAYLWGCGALFVVYIAAIYAAIGIAATNSQVITVGLINYLWPALSLVFSIPLLGKRWRPLLLIGIVLALAGTWLAMGSTSAYSAGGAMAGGRALTAYALALIAAVCWGLYSNLSRRWGGEEGASGVPLFLLASGLALLVLRLFAPEESAWSLAPALIALYLGLGPGMMGYILWDFSMRRGDMVLVASLSYATPLLSSLISILVLGVTPGAGWWLAVFMVMAGAVICKASITDSPAAS